MTLIDYFNTIFGSYSPIQNVVSDDGVNVVYSYSIDWGILAHYGLVLILFWTVCKCISLIFVNFSRGVLIK